MGRSCSSQKRRKNNRLLQKGFMEMKFEEQKNILLPCYWMWLCWKRLAKDFRCFFSFFLSMCRQWEWTRGRPADGQLVPESFGGIYCRGDTGWRHDLFVRECQQIHGSHPGNFVPSHFPVIVIQFLETRHMPKCRKTSLHFWKKIKNKIEIDCLMCQANALCTRQHCFCCCFLSPFLSKL